MYTTLALYHGFSTSPIVFSSLSMMAKKELWKLYGNPASRKYNPPFSGSTLFCADPLSGSKSRSVT